MFWRILENLTRRKRRVLTAAIDLTLLMAVVWSLMSLRYQTVYVPPTLTEGALFAAGPLITVFTLLLFRVYHGVARYIGPRGVWRMFALACLTTLIWSTLLFVVGQNGIPRSVILVYPIAGTLVIVLFRLFAAAVLRQRGINLYVSSVDKGDASVPVLVVGTGELAVQVGRALSSRHGAHLVGFIDSTRSMIGRWIDNVRVFDFERIPLLIADQGVKEIIIATEKQSFADRRRLILQLQKYHLLVKVMPSVEQLPVSSDRLQLREVEGGDLLGREEIPTNSGLLGAAVTDKVILVTGAGGTIGSQIARRSLDLGVKTLVLLENSELALYQVEQMLRDKIGTMSEPPNLQPYLGSVQDRMLVDSIFANHAVDTVFHAAAFKHVPIVERHPAVGLSNNTFGTETVARAAMDHRVANFVLISTDKAVLPRNVLGASKRAAELILKQLTRETTKTAFSAVRFGNVLGSSGSVVHRFKDQIRAGGPVTVTDPNVVRYFMSIDEAVNLVLQCAGIARGGEIFNLEMGAQVKIAELARSMIRLMGLKERTPENPDGDIEIQYTGLRPGEKLIEDLYGPDDNLCGTVHPRIVKVEEAPFDTEKFQRNLDSLKLAVRSRDDALIVNALANLVDTYAPDVEQMSRSYGGRSSGALH